MIANVTFYADGNKFINKLHKFRIQDHKEAMDVVISFAVKGFKIRAAWYNVLYDTGKVDNFKMDLSVMPDLLKDLSEEPDDLEIYRTMIWYYSIPK